MTTRRTLVFLWLFSTPFGCLEAPEVSSRHQEVVPAPPHALPTAAQPRPNLSFATPTPGLRSTTPAGMRYQGQASASSRGAALYDVPLWLPPGRSGLIPDFALRYRSDVGTGVLGRGWSLGEQSSIRRCNRSRSLDGDNRGVQHDGMDPLCLDGRRLRFDGTSGTACKTLSDGSYVESVNLRPAGGSGGGYDADYFIRHLPDGSKQFYGQLTGSTGAPHRTARGFGARWMLSRTEDRDGNFITYHYATQNNPVLTSIVYTGHPSAPATRRVDLEYRARTGGSVWMRQNNFRTRSQDILTVARVYVDNALVRAYRFEYEIGHDGREQLSAFYSCDGEPPEDLATHRHSATGGAVCNQGVSFTYTGQNYGVPTPISVDLSSARIVDGTFQLSDVNSDGLDDLVYVTDGLGSKHLVLRTGMGDGQFGAPLALRDISGSHAWLRIVDLNRDGRNDIVFALHKGDTIQSPVRGSEAGWWVLFSPKPGSSWPSPQKFMDYASGQDLFGDLDGDGFVDLLACRHPNSKTPSNGVMRTYFNSVSLTASGDVSQVFRRDDTAAPSQRCGYDSSKTIHQILDIDGDGVVEHMSWHKDDLWQVRTTDWHRDASGVLSTVRANLAYYSHSDLARLDFKPRFGDFDGTGTLDFLMRYHKSDWLGNWSPDDVLAYGSSLNLFQSAANPLEHSLPPVWAIDKDDPPNTNAFAEALVAPSTVVTDVTGDGRDDIVTAYADRLEIFEMQGDGFLFPAHRQHTLPLSGLREHVRFGDINGDGISDILLARSNDIQVLLSTGPSDLLSTVNETPAYANAPATFTFEYSSLADTNGDHVYTRDGAQRECERTSLHQICLSGGRFQVVKTLYEDVGGDFPPREIRYRYHRGRLDLRDAQFLGFEEFTRETFSFESPNSAGISQGTTTQFYDLETTWPLPAGSGSTSGYLYPFIGAPVRSEHRVSVTDVDGATTDAVLVEERTFQATTAAPGMQCLTSALESDRKVTLSLGVGEPLRLSDGTLSEKNIISDELLTYDQLGVYGRPQRIRREKRLSNAEVLCGESLTTYEARMNPFVTGLETRVSESVDRMASTSCTWPLVGGRQKVRTAQFDPKGHLLEARVREASDPLSLVHSFGYDNQGHRIYRLTTGNNGDHRYTEYMFAGSVAGEPTLIQRWNLATRYQGPLEISQLSNSVYGLPTRQEGPDGVETIITYDTFGREVERLLPDGTTQRVSWSDANQGGEVEYFSEVTHTSPSGELVSPPSRVYYDRLGRPVVEATILADGSVSKRSRVFGPNGRERYLSAPSTSGIAEGWASEYDVLGRKIRHSSPSDSAMAPSIQEFRYGHERDGSGSIIGSYIEATSPRGHRARTSFNFGGDVIRIDDYGGDDVGSSISYEYEVDGSPRSAYYDDDPSVAWHWRVDAYGLVEQIWDPNMGLESRSYNAWGDLTETTFADGAQQRVRYDGYGRVVEEIDSDASGNQTTSRTVTWDSAPNGRGEVHFEVAFDGETRVTDEYSYDAVHRRVGLRRTFEERDSSGNISQTAAFNDYVIYDDGGRARGHIYPAAADGTLFATVNQFHNGYLVSVADAFTQSPLWLLGDASSGMADFTDAQDAFGRVKAFTYGNQLFTQRSFTPSGLLASTRSKGPGGSTLHERSFQYDPDKNLTYRTDAVSGTEEAFGYDEVGRLFGTCTSLSGAASQPQNPAPSTTPPSVPSNTQVGDSGILQRAGDLLDESEDIDGSGTPLAGATGSTVVNFDDTANVTPVPSSPLTPDDSVLIGQVGVPASSDGTPIGSRPVSDGCLYTRYDKRGNIRVKDGVGDYFYDFALTRRGIDGSQVTAALPHAVGRIPDPSTGAANRFAYDERGAALHIPGLGDRPAIDIDRWPDGRPRQINAGPHEETRFYDRSRALALRDGDAEKRWYLGGFQRRVTQATTSVLQAGAKNTSHYFIDVDGNTIAEVIHYEGPISLQSSSGDKPRSRGSVAS